MSSLQRLTEALAGRYRIERELGQGGMATVYLSEDIKHHRRVAIKVLRADLAAVLGPDRFLREIETTANLRHPHILPLFDSGTAGQPTSGAGNDLYYVMPYVEGESLRDRLSREKQLPLDDAVQIAREVADALSYAHSRGVIHRDIKPENILLEGGHAVVADFGIARAIHLAGGQPLTQSGMALGTPQYMSPEQALGETDLDGRSDIYALACVLYEMLTGVPPYAARTAQASIARRLSEPVPQVRHLRDAVPSHLEHAIMRALARIPADRFRSAAEFRDALIGGRGSRDSQDEVAVGVGVVREGGLSRSRRRSWLAITALAAVTLLVLAIALPWSTRRRGRGLLDASAAMPGVAVLPFRTTGADSALWHEGIVDMLSYNLDGLGQIRKIDPVTVLTGWRRMGGSASNPLSADDAREVGRRLGSRYVITGGAVQVGADLQLIAEVHDVEMGEMRGSVRVTRPADSASTLVDELTLELLRRNLLPTDGEYPPPSLSRATTSSLPALKEYLAGEREYRTAHWSAAVRHYHRAIEADSNFASAWFRLSGACGWGGCARALEEEYARRALDLADRLPVRDAKRIRAQTTGDVGALEALTVTYPDDVEAWVALGESYYHQGGVTLRPNEGYREAFRRAIALHPYYGEAYLHLIEDAFLRLDSLDAQRLIDGYIALGGNSACSDQVSHDLVWGTAAARARAMTVLDTVELMQCTQAPMAAPPEVLDRLAGLHSAAADTATQANHRTVLLWRMLQVRVPNGQITAARRALSRLVAVDDIRAARASIMLHLSGFPDSATMRQLVRMLAAEGTATDHFWLGAIAIEEGRWADLEDERRTLERLTPGVEADDSLAVATARAFAAGLKAYAMLVKGNRDLAEFETALARLPVYGWDIEQPQQFLRYRVGKLLFDQGRTHDAERYFRSFQPYNFFYTSPAELYLGRIAEASGRAQEAATHYGRVTRWWRYADESLRAQWDEARQALSRLAGE